MRKYSEGEVRKALGAMDLQALVYKPQDMPGPSQQTKPADFLVWYREAEPASAMVEVKETDHLTKFSIKEMFTTSQLATMERARKVGLRYLVAVRWSSLKRWTITTGPRVLSRWSPLAGSYWRVDMPIDCPPGDLASHLRMALLGEIDD